MRGGLQLWRCTAQDSTESEAPTRWRSTSCFSRYMKEVRLTTLQTLIIYFYYFNYIGECIPVGQKLWGPLELELQVDSSPPPRHEWWKLNLGPLAGQQGHQTEKDAFYDAFSMTFWKRKLGEQLQRLIWSGPWGLRWQNSSTWTYEHTILYICHNL